MGSSSFLRKISKYNSKNLLERVWGLFKKLEPQEKQLPDDVQKMVITIRASKDIFNQKINITIEPNSTQATVSKQSIQSLVQIPVTQSMTQSTIANNPSYTIQEIFDDMLRSSTSVEDTKIRKKNAITKMLKDVGLSLKDAYTKFHDRNVINQIIQNVMDIENLKNAGKKVRLSYIKELVMHACAMEPDYFSSKVIAGMPTIKKDDSSDDNGHLPYSDDQLLNIFDPKHDFFKNNPDRFWVCMVSLFTGARANPAITLQYKDIINENGIDCFHFRVDHKAKRFKNKASRRKVPIHHQLLDLGFVDYVRRKKGKINANDDDFIFDDAVHENSRKYNNNYISRKLTPFLKEIGVKQESYDGYDFHSFRDTISKTLQKKLLPPALINRIIGWEDKQTYEKYYSKFTLEEIKETLEKAEYDFLKPHFAKWKKIMAKKP